MSWKKTSHWQAWTPATTPDKARRVGQRLLEAVGALPTSLRIEPYPKTNGHVLTFDVPLAALAWAETVVALLATAQSVGHQWGILGRIDEELELITNQVSLPGVSMLTCRIERSAHEVKPEQRADNARGD